LIIDSRQHTEQKSNEKLRVRLKKEKDEKLNEMGTLKPSIYAVFNANLLDMS